MLPIYSADLPQGGLEVPCKLKFQGSPLSINKVKKLLPDAPSPDTSANDSIIPAKKMKMDTDVQLDQPTGVWLSLVVLNEVISLSHSDRRDLCNSDKMLNDNCIKFAQNILRIEFPLIEGLESVLLQESSKLKKITDGIQIVHARGNHWITVSTFDTCEREVNVYDSLYSSVDDGTLKIIRNPFCE